MTSGNTSIAPLTLAFAVVACRLLPARCREFAARSPPAVRLTASEMVLRSVAAWFVTLSGRCRCRTLTGRGTAVALAEEARRRGGRALDWVAWSMLALFIVSVAFATILAVADDSFQQDPAGFGLFVLGFGAFMVVGALVVAHRPRNPIGWMFSAIALLAFTGGVAGEYATYSLVTRPGSLPGATLAAWYASWPWYLTLGLALVFTPVVPHRSAAVAPLAAGCLAGRGRDGRVHGAGRPPGRAGPGQRSGDRESDRDRRSGEPRAEHGRCGPARPGDPLRVVAFVSLVIRFRRSRGEERQQLKWFTYAAAWYPWRCWATPCRRRWDRLHGADRVLAGRGRDRDPALPAVRHRPADQPHPGLRVAHCHSWTGLRRCRPSPRASVRRGRRNPPSWAVAGATLAVAALSGRSGAAFRWSRIDALTGASTTPSGRSRRSALGCATRST